MIKKFYLRTRTRSLSFRMGILVFLTFFMLALFLVFNNIYAISVVRENAFDATAEMMSMYMNRVDDAFKKIETYWAGIQYAGDLTTLLSTSRPADYYAAWARLKMAMENAGPTYSYVDDLFVYYPPAGDYLDAGYMLDENERVLIKRMIKREIDGLIQREEKIAGEWQCLEVEGEYYFVRIFRTSDIYMGSCVKVSRLVSEMQRDGFEKADYLTFYENGGGELGNTLSGMNHLPDISGEPLRLTVNLDRQKYLVLSQPSDSGNFSMTAMIRDTNIMARLGDLQKVIILLSMGILVFIGGFTAVCREWILRPVKKLCQAMGQLKNGDFSVRLGDGKSCNEFNLVNETFDNMIENIHALKIDVYEEKIQRQKAELRYQKAELQYQKAELQYQKAELQYMKLQINPHFYINCLNIIHNLSLMNKNRLVRDMTTYLGNHLRYTLEGNTVDRLSREIDYVRNYVHIQEIRFADSLQTFIEVEKGVENVRVPPLIIQTFVENTVKYQVVVGEQTEIFIVVSWCDCEADHRIRIQIWDNGEGFSEEILAALSGSGVPADERGEHIGIRNVVQRLKLIYHGRESVCFSNHEETGGACIVIELPDDGGAGGAGVQPDGGGADVSMGAGSAGVQPGVGGAGVQPGVGSAGVRSDDEGAGGADVSADDV